MDLLFKREQSRTFLGRVIFKLWAKTELSEDEQLLLDRYSFGSSLLLDGDDTGLLKSSGIVASIAALLFFVIWTVFLQFQVYYLDAPGLVALSILAGIGAGYWWFNERRERIFVRDLLFGRRFKCRSVVELAQKEAELTYATSILRQVVETAKHWEGVETVPVPALPKEAAKELVQGLR